MTLKAYHSKKRSEAISIVLQATFNPLPRSIQLHLGEDVIIMGYPLGLSDHIRNLPILRNGILASAYAIPFNGNPYFLIDSYLEK